MAVAAIRSITVSRRDSTGRADRRAARESPASALPVRQLRRATKRDASSWCYAEPDRPPVGPTAALPAERSAAVAAISPGPPGSLVQTRDTGAPPPPAARTTTATTKPATTPDTKHRHPTDPAKPTSPPSRSVVSGLDTEHDPADVSRMMDRMDVSHYRPRRLSATEEEAVDGHHHLRADAMGPTAWCRSGPASCGSASSHGSTSRRARAFDEGVRPRDLRVSVPNPLRTSGPPGV